MRWKDAAAQVLEVVLLWGELSPAGELGMRVKVPRYGWGVAGLVVLPILVTVVVRGLGLSGRVWDVLPVAVFVGVVVVMIGMGVGLARRLACQDIWEREGKCLKCGYDRAGLKSGEACPECGERGV